MYRAIFLYESWPFGACIRGRENLPISGEGSILAGKSFQLIQAWCFKIVYQRGKIYFLKPEIWSLQNNYHTIQDFRIAYWYVMRYPMMVLPDCLHLLTCAHHSCQKSGNNSAKCWQHPFHSKQSLLSSSWSTAAYCYVGTLPPVFFTPACHLFNESHYPISA